MFIIIMIAIIILGAKWIYSYEEKQKGNMQKKSKAGLMIIGGLYGVWKGFTDYVNKKY